MMPSDDALLTLLDALPLVPARAATRFGLGQRVVVQRPRGTHAIGVITRMLGSGARATAEVQLEARGHAAGRVVVVPDARMNPAMLTEGMGATLMLDGAVVTGAVQRVAASGRVCWIALDHVMLVRDADGTGRDRRYFAPNPTGALRQASLGEDGRWTLAGRERGLVALGVRECDDRLVRAPAAATARRSVHA